MPSSSGFLVDVNGVILACVYGLVEAPATLMVNGTAVPVTFVDGDPSKGAVGQHPPEA